MEPPKNQSVKLVQISEQQAGQRLDNFLFTQLKGVPKGHVYKVIRRGEVRVNKGRVKNVYKLKSGDVVRIPPIRQASETEEVTLPAGFLQTIEQQIIYEDKGLLVINKPSGVAVHGGSGLNFGLIEGLRVLRPDVAFLELVHRIDRDTSGCLMVAKSRSTLKQLHDLFRKNQIRKTYLALLHGVLHRDQVCVSAPLEKSVLQSGERMVRVHPSGKPSETLFVPEQRFQSATLVSAYPKTGRTHQIRVHAQSIQHPIVGDERYSPTELRKQFRQLGFKRLFLHAHRLAYRDEESGRVMQFEAPLDPSLKQCLQQLD